MFQNYAAKLRKCQLRLQMAAIRRAVVGACTAVMLTLLFVLILYGSGAQMIKLSGIGHVLLKVADQEASKRFYRDILGFRIAEEEPEHGGVFMTLGESFHTLDLGQHPNPKDAPRPQRGQIGLAHIAFQVGSYAALRDAYAHLIENGVEIMRATNHKNVGLCWNSNPTDIVEGSVKSSFDLLRPWLKSCHINELPGPYPYKELFGLMKKTGYDRWTLCECAESKEPERFLKYYRALWRELMS